MEKKVDLMEVGVRIQNDGPDRVIINAEGEAISARRAALRGITPDIIFIRNDGWSLGAPAHLKEVARKQWKDDWIGEMKLVGDQMEFST